MRKQILTIVVIAIFALTCLSVALTVQDSEDSDAYVINDYKVGDRTFSEPAQHVVTMGKAFTITVISLGSIDKLSAVDTSSKNDISELSGGSMYSYPTNVDGYNELKQRLDILVDGGNWVKNRDMVITYGYATSANVELLTNEGYIVVQFYPKSYDETVTYVQSMEKILGTPEAQTLSQNMITVKANIMEKVSEGSAVKVSAIYAGYSSNTLRIANTGITADLIISGGGINAGYDASITNVSYTPGDGFFELKKQQGATVIFVDGNYAGTAEEFKTNFNIPDGYRILKLDAAWNSYTPELSDGLVAMYDFMYVTQTAPTPGTDNTTVLYAALGVIAIFGLGAAFIFLRRR